MTDVTITFPDGKTKQVASGTTGLDIAKGISPSLAKRTVAMQLDGVLCDLADPITKDAKINFISRTDPPALELIRHDAAHVMAEAVQSLWPGTQVTIGPVIDNGFYYDFAKAEPFHPDDLGKIEKKMHEIIAKNAPFTKEEWSRDQAKKFFAEKGETFKVELVDAIPEDQSLKIYKQGTWLDLCRGPHMTSTGAIGKAFKLQKFAGAYWRGDSTKPQLQRIYGTAWASEEELKAYLTQLEEAEKARPPQTWPRDGSVPLPGGSTGLDLLAPEGLDPVPDAHLLHAPRTAARGLRGSELARHDGAHVLGAIRPLAELRREHVHHHAA